MLTPHDLAAIEERITKAINHTFATHPRLARMEKREGQMQRDINYLVEAFDAPDRWQRKADHILRDHELRLHRLENRPS